MVQFMNLRFVVHAAEQKLFDLFIVHWVTWKKDQTCKFLVQISGLDIIFIYFSTDKRSVLDQSLVLTSVLTSVLDTSIAVSTKS